MLKNLSRLTKEIKFLAETPGPGISAAPTHGNMLEFCASITGPEDSPYAGGLFKLKLDLPENYPFEPPKAQFTTPIYHPNIDSEGRICLDTLKPQPQGSWSPSITINTLLLSIRLLLMHPNAEDGLVPDITELFKRDYATYKRNAIQHTIMNALAPAPAAPPFYDDKNHTMDVSTAGRASTHDSRHQQGDPTKHNIDDITDAVEKSCVIPSDKVARPENECEYEYEYEYVADGYTLIGCNPGSQGQILQSGTYRSGEQEAIVPKHEKPDVPSQEIPDESVTSKKRQRRK